jgi:hypothetical protein
VENVAPSEDPSLAAAQRVIALVAVLALMQLRRGPIQYSFAITRLFQAIRHMVYELGIEPGDDPEITYRVQPRLADAIDDLDPIRLNEMARSWWPSADNFAWDLYVCFSKLESRSILRPGLAQEVADRMKASAEPHHIRDASAQDKSASIDALAQSALDALALPEDLGVLEPPELEQLSTYLEWAALTTECKREAFSVTADACRSVLQSLLTPP